MKTRKICLLCFIMMLLLCACSFSDVTDFLETVGESMVEKLSDDSDDLSSLRGIVEPIPEDEIRGQTSVEDDLNRGSTDIAKQSSDENFSEEERVLVSGKNTETVDPKETEDAWKEALRGEVTVKGDDGQEENAGSLNSNSTVEWKKGNTPLPEGCMTEANSFYYNRLSEEDKLIYREILRGLLNLERAELAPSAEEAVDRVFKSVMFDHPEIFYVFGYNCTKEYLGKELQHIYISGTMNIEPAEVQKRKLLIEEQTQSILAELQNIQEPYEITKYLYRYIINNTEYDKHSVDNQNICSVFLNHRSVCSGYAKAFQYLMQKKGIQTGLIQGTVKGGNPHAWNMVLLDGEYYYVDVTWGDSSYNYEGQKAAEGVVPGVLYDYLCVTTAELCKTHQIDPIVPIPVCVAEKNNYFRREGCYFTNIDEAGLQQVFAKGYGNNEATVTIKCSDNSVYDGMVQYLVNEQKIFQYLQKTNGTVSYAGNKDMCSITFWL